jgi:hypothetical protein
MKSLLRVGVLALLFRPIRDFVLKFLKGARDQAAAQPKPAVGDKLVMIGMDKAVRPEDVDKQPSVSFRVANRAGTGLRKGDAVTVVELQANELIVEKR